MSEPRRHAPGLRWIKAEALWLRGRDDVLARVFSVVWVARCLLAIHAALVNVFLVLPRSSNPFGVVGATVVMLLWQAFITLRLRRPHRRTMVTVLADTGVSIAIVFTTALVVPPGAAPLTLAGYWAAGCAAYAVVFFGTWRGTVVAVIMWAALVVIPGHVTMERVGVGFVATLLTFSLGSLIDQFRNTLVEQEQERIRAAALAERERLSRIVHDGALQVLALVEREGPALGERGMRLAALARESEAQLRTLLQDREVIDVERTKTVDLAARLDKYQSAKVTVSTMASLVRVPRLLADEVEATLAEILKNVESHAGPGAQAWILLDQENDDEVILWVRDNGKGMSAEQVAAAARAGRMGIKDSIVGRMSALGGSAILKSSPGAGTEWELRFPIDVEAVE